MGFLGEKEFLFMFMFRKSYKKKQSTSIKKLLNNEKKQQKMNK
jgi:hypothetical protein